MAPVSLSTRRPKSAAANGGVAVAARQPEEATMPVPNNRSERTILRYVKLDFRGAWEWDFDEYSFRPVGKEAELLVVSEIGNVLVTHSFLVRRREHSPDGGVWTTDNVLAPKEENIVYIPERCRWRAEGDKTSCSRIVVRPPVATRRRKQRRASA
jgi:hypothetical protein